MKNITKQPYRVLARKYRPATFEQMIGQDALVQTLTNAIALGRLAHAFILTGVRGVGKTSTARILAKGSDFGRTSCNFEKRVRTLGAPDAILSKGFGLWALLLQF